MAEHITLRRARPRLASTALLVVLALGGAGFAVAADRPPASLRQADHAAAVDEAARARLRALGEAAAIASAAGRDALGQLQALNIDGVAEPLARGTDAIHGLDDSGLVSAWAVIEDRATIVAELLDLLRRHDTDVFEATAAGRDSDWAAAVAALAEASPLLSRANDIRGRLESVADTATLSDLLDRYATYDAALAALYAHLGGGGTQGDQHSRDLAAAVERAQAALPRDNRVLSLIVAETAGEAITDALLDIERIRNGA